MNYILHLIFFLISSICIINSQNTQISGTSINGNTIGINKWQGFELSTSYIITKITWYQKDDPSKYILGIFQGANEPNFIDAIPIHMIKEEHEQNEPIDIDISLNFPFKYIRYVSSNNLTMISGFKIYGYENDLSTNNKILNYFQVTNIPLVIINTDEPFIFDPLVDIWKEEKQKVNCNVIIINNGEININKKGKIKLRGNSSLMFPKKPYQITLDSETKILNMNSNAKKWNLIANFMDKTLLRNMVAYKVSSMIGLKYSVQCESVDVIFNGVYDGTYMLCDKIEKGENRVQLDTLNESISEEPEISGGYLLCIEYTYVNTTDNISIIQSKNGIPLTIKYPEKVTLKQSNYIKNWISNIESEIYNKNNTKNIDINSFVQYFILQEFCADIDSMWGSNFIYKNKYDEKLYYGPGWDYDLALDNDWRLFPTNKEKSWIYNRGGSAGTLRNLTSKILSQKNVINELKSYWKKITENDFNSEKLLKYVDEIVENIYQSQKFNFIKWKILGKKVGYEANGYNSFDEAVENLKKFIEERFEVLGNKIMSADENSFPNDPVFREGEGKVADWEIYGWNDY